MLLGAFLAPTVAHAFTGNVSVNGGAIIGVPASATTVAVPIEISNANTFNTFDIQVFADPTVLQASSVSLSGSVLSGALIIAECFNGILVAGNTCSPQDGPGVVHLVASSTSNAGTAPVAGTLFTINYNIVGSSSNSPVVFNTGCSNTSTGNSDCVTIPGAPVTDQGAVFSNLINFSMTPAFAKLSTPAGTSINDLISYASEGGFSDVLLETVTASAGLSATLASGSPGLVDLSNPPATGSDTLTVSAASAGSYSVTVQTCGTNNFPTTCNSRTIPVLVAAPGFSVAASPSSVTISRGNTDSSTASVTASGNSGFSGTVSYSCTVGCGSGITASAPMATLTPDGSGYSSASSGLTIAVASTVASGTYSLTISGASGSSHTTTISVVVPTLDFAIVAVPNAISIVRGGTVAANLNLFSLGNFAGTASFSASVTPIAGQQDSCCLTNNITPAFAPITTSLTAGGTVTVSFFASTVGGTAPPATLTATGNYTAVITATVTGSSGTIIRATTITFNIEDFSLGTGLCNDPTGTNVVPTTPNGNDEPVWVNGACNSLSITDTPNLLAAGTTSVGFQGVPITTSQVLWVQTNALGGLVTDGFNGTPAIAALNPDIPTNGVTVPQLAADFPAPTPHLTYPNKMCLLPTFWPNGTQIPYSYLEQNGPLITPGGGLYAALSIIAPNSFPPGALGNWGCKFDAGAFPNDRGINELNDFLMTHFNRRHTHTLCQLQGPGFFWSGDPGCPYPTIPNNPDFFAVTAMSIVGTLAGTYTFQLCAQGGVLIHCNMYTLNVLKSAVVHQLVVKKTVSFSASGGSLLLKVGVTNPDLSHTVFATVTASGIGSSGDTFSATSSEVTIGPNANANNIQLSIPLTSSMIGETFTFSFVISESADPNNLDGTSTSQTIQQTITITA